MPKTYVTASRRSNSLVHRSEVFRKPTCRLSRAKTRFAMDTRSQASVCTCITRSPTGKRPWASDRSREPKHSARHSQANLQHDPGYQAARTRPHPRMTVAVPSATVQSPQNLRRSDPHRRSRFTRRGGRRIDATLDHAATLADLAAKRDQADIEGLLLQSRFTCESITRRSRNAMDAVSPVLALLCGNRRRSNVV